MHSKNFQLTICMTMAFFLVYLSESVYSQSSYGHGNGDKCDCDDRSPAFYDMKLSRAPCLDPDNENKFKEKVLKQIMSGLAKKIGAGSSAGVIAEHLVSSTRNATVVYAKFYYLCCTGNEEDCVWRKEEKKVKLPGIPDFFGCYLIPESIPDVVRDIRLAKDSLECP